LQNSTHQKFAKTSFSMQLLHHWRFFFILAVWIGLFVGLMRNRWIQIKDRELIQTFKSSTAESVKRFESHIEFWREQSKKIEKFSRHGPVDVLNLQQTSWAEIYNSHPEWLATHVINEVSQSEAKVRLMLISKKAIDLSAKDTESPLPWAQEISSNALQLPAFDKAELPFAFQSVRSLNKNANWIQVLFKIKKSIRESTWVVHTFSEEIFPDLLNLSETNEAVILQPQVRKFFASANFSKLRIEHSEIRSLLERKKDQKSGFAEQSFALAKKPIWLSWTFSNSLQFFFVKILPNNKIPSTSRKDSPSILGDWILTTLWLAITSFTLWWTYSKKMWDFKDYRGPTHPTENQLTPANSLYSGDAAKQGQIAFSVMTSFDAEKEFCRQLLNHSGPEGELRFDDSVCAKIEVTPSRFYRGSFWIIERLDEGRIFVAVGDSSGKGLAAGTTAYTVRRLIEDLVRGEGKAIESEPLLGLIYNQCHKTSSGVLLGSAHFSLFACIVELEKHKCCFVNAGYPAPLLRLGEKKTRTLNPYADPIGFGSEGTPLPRWVNLSPYAELIFCNIGSRNTDLNELDDSELIKIFVYPYGRRQETKILDVDEIAANVA